MIQTDKNSKGRMFIELTQKNVTQAKKTIDCIRMMIVNAVMMLREMVIF